MLSQFVNRINDEFCPDTDYLSLIRNIMNNLKEPSSVENVVEALHQFDRLLNTEENLFIYVFDNVFKELGKFLLNQNPEIVHASLYLLSEVLSKSWLTPEIKDWMVYLIPIVLRLSNLNDGSLDEHSYVLLSKCLEKIPKFCLCEETALTLLHAITNENSDYAARACGLFTEFIRYSDKFFLIEVFEWNEIFEIIRTLFIDDRKREIAVSIILFLKNEIFSIEEWEDIMLQLDYEYFQFLLSIVKFDYASVNAKKKKFMVV